MVKNKEPPIFHFEYYTEKEYCTAINGARRWFLKVYRTKNLGDQHMDDLIHEAFKLLANGDRTWDPERELVWSLTYIIRSIASHEISKQKKMINLKEDQLKFLPTVTEANHPCLPDDNFQSNQIVELLRVRVYDTGDDLLIKLFTYIYYGQTPEGKVIEPLDDGDNVSLADALGISLKDLLNLKKRLKRLINSLRNEVVV